MIDNLIARLADLFAAVTRPAPVPVPVRIDRRPHR